MALKKCSECGGQISTSAKACPHCGHVTKNQVAQGCGGLAVIGLLIVLAVGYFGNRSSSKKPEINNTPDVAALSKAEEAISNAVKDPQKVKLMECAGVKVYEDPQPAGHPPSPEECAQIEQSAGIPPDDVARLITREEDLNDKCRGGSGDSPDTQLACDSRDRLVSQIEMQGWCWGPAEVPEADKKWLPCRKSN